MKVVQFIYKNQSIDFMFNNELLMVNATQMAKMFGKRLDVFLKSDHAKAFIQELQRNTFIDKDKPLQLNEIMLKRGSKGTWMHRILALKFAAWLDTEFELWVFSTINKLMIGHYSDLSKAALEEIIAQREFDEKKEKLISKNPNLTVFFDLLDKNPELLDVLKLRQKVKVAEQKKIKALPNNFLTA